MRGEARVPVGLPRGAALARAPRRVDRLRNRERRVRPAERRARGGDLLLAERRAVHGLGALLVRRALADHRLAADERRAVGDGLRRRDGRVDGVDVVAVDAADHVPAVRLEASRRVVGEPAGDVAVDRDAVVVVERDELAQPPRAGERARLVRDALHQAAVADEHVRVVVDDRVARHVELACEQRLGERHAHRVGEALAERAGRRLHAGRNPRFRVSRRLRVQLAERGQLGHRQVVAGEVQQRVLQHRAVAVGQHEAVAVGPVRVGRVVREVAVPQRDRDIGHAHRHARVPGLGLFDRVHRERANRVGKFNVGGACGGRSAHGLRPAEGRGRKRPVQRPARLTHCGTTGDRRFRAIRVR